MELTDQEKEDQCYAARAFESRYGLIQQVATDLLGRMVSREGLNSVLPLDAMPAQAMKMAVVLVEHFDRYVEENGDRLRDYLQRRHRKIRAQWDPSKFSAETWLKSNLNSEDTNQ